MEATIVSGAWKGHLGRGLAPKELQYLLGTAQGMTAKEIARQFDVAACTVAKRLSCAMFKLGVTRQTAMIAEATLPGWEHSKGARLEVLIAERLDMTIVDAHDLVSREAV